MCQIDLPKINDYLRPCKPLTTNSVTNYVGKYINTNINQLNIRSFLLQGTWSPEGKYIPPYDWLAYSNLASESKSFVGKE